jgi:DNA-binding transcriptional MerR regulator
MSANRYTAAMLAELVGVHVSRIRSWQRRGWIVPATHTHRLAYFDFQELTVARQLAELHRLGASPQLIAKKLAEIERRLTELTALRDEFRGLLADWDRRLETTPEGMRAGLLERLEKYDRDRDDLAGSLLALLSRALLDLTHLSHGRTLRIVDDLAHQVFPGLGGGQEIDACDREVLADGEDDRDENGVQRRDPG